MKHWKSPECWCSPTCFGGIDGREFRALHSDGTVDVWQTLNETDFSELLTALDEVNDDSPKEGNKP